MISKSGTPMEVLEDSILEASEAFAIATGVRPTKILIGWMTHNGRDTKGAPLKEVTVLDVKVSVEPI